MGKSANTDIATRTGRKAAPSAKPLFRAMSRKPSGDQLSLGDFPQQEKPDTRDPLDYDPTPHSATQAVLAQEIDHIRAHGNVVWETAVGGGHIAHVLGAAGFDVIGTDVEHRGWAGTRLRSFFDHSEALSPIEFTNPPYCEINARDGHGRWFWHGQQLGLRYRAMLLNTDWPAARINGMDRMFRDHPPSVEYLCCWKIDFRGGGAPPQRNSWFIWDVNRPPLGPDQWIRKRLYRDAPDPSQPKLI